MTLLRPFIFAFSAIALAGCYGEKSPGTDPAPPTIVNIGDPDRVVKGLLRLKLSEELPFEPYTDPVTGGFVTGHEGLDQFLKDNHVTRIRRVFRESPRFEKRAREVGLHLWYEVRLSDSVDFGQTLATRSSYEFLSEIETVRKITVPGVGSRPVPVSLKGPVTRSSGHFNDPGLSRQWYLDNEGNWHKDAIAGADINIIPAWGVTTGTPEVIVAVIDGGIQTDHADLAAMMWQNPLEVDGDLIDNDYNGYTDDIYGWNFVTDSPQIVPENHGTHVAGIIAAQSNNGIGISGIAGGSGNGDGVRLMSCQIYMTDPDNPDEGIFAEDQIPDAIRYAADNGAVICQNSWNYEFGPNEPPILDGATRAAINYFIEFAGRDVITGNQTGPLSGGVVIFSAGNESSERISYPAGYNRVISVAAMAPDYRKAYYSNYGDWVIVTAPGGSKEYQESYSDECMILSTIVYDSDPDLGYGYMEGTSMAAPMVSGAAALAVSHYSAGITGYEAQTIKDLIINTTGELKFYNPGYLNKLGSGYLNTGSLLIPSMNTPPELLERYPNTYLGSVSEAMNIDLARHFSDDDFASLRYTVHATIDQFILHSISEDGIMTIVPRKFGTGTVTITARNSHNLYVGMPFRLTCRDDSEKFDPYPNPTSGLLYIRTGPGEPERVRVTLHNSSGRLCYDASVETDPFYPEYIDVSELAAGIYTVTVHLRSGKAQKSIIKI